MKTRAKETLLKKEDFREKSYWMTTREYSPGEPLRGRIDVDTAVIGGGYTGLSTAYHLKKDEPSMKIALLEGQVAGFGASGRNAGFSMTLFGLSLSVTALRFGKEKAMEAHRYMERSVDTTRDLIETLGLDCDYEHNGFLRIATSEKYKKRILHDMELFHKMGITDVQWIDREKTREEVNSPQYLGALWEPRSGILNPAKLSWSWADKLREMNIDIYENTPVTEISRKGKKLRLVTPEGEVYADKVVLATNAWSHFFPQLKRKQIPVWTHIVLTEPLRDEHFREIRWQNRQGVEDARNLVHYYRLTRDNRLLMGGRDVSLTYNGWDMDHDLNEATFAGLKKDVGEIFPVLKGIRYTHQWGGPVSVPLDMAPVIGYAGDKRVVYSLGCMGHAVSMTHLNGRTLAEMVLEKKTGLTDTFFVDRTTIPWPPQPLTQLATKAVLGYLHREDRIFDEYSGG
jgi:glycine/D-amino acid oxidase-like deaminating enzyme